MTPGENQRNDRQDAAAEARAWLVRFQSGSTTQGDLQLFARWRAGAAAHEAAFQTQLRLWQGLGPALAHHERRTTVQPGALLSRRGVLGGGTALAASVLAGVMLVGIDSAPAGATVLQTTKGERRRATLANGAAIELNTDSRLFVWPDRIELDRGEAVIAVDYADRRRLLAYAGETEIIARRARFLLNEDGTDTRVTCLEGAIAIRAAGQSYTLAKGAALAVTDGAATVMAPAPIADGDTAWRRGLLVFNDRPAAEVVAQLNRYRAGHVFLPGDRAAIRISGVIHLDRVDLAVEHIARSLGMKVVNLPGGLAILRD